MNKIFSGKLTTLFAGALLSCCVFSGCCVSTPVSLQRPASLPALRVSDKEVARRKAEFAKAFSGKGTRAVAVYPSSWKDVPADEVINKVVSYCFDSVYFVVTSELELDDNLEELLISASKAKLSSHIVLRQRDFYKRVKGNTLTRLFVAESPDIVEMAELVSDFADSLDDDAKVSGFTIMLEPHRFNAVEQRRGADSCFIWDDRSYGIGLDNDMLMNKSFTDFALAAKASDLPFVPAVYDFYHELAKEKKLSKGSINEVAKLSSSKKDVLLISTGSRPSAVAENIKNEFAGAADCRIKLVFMVADHLSVNESVFRRRNFTDFVRGIKYGTSKLAGKKAYNGIITGPLRVLDYMCHEEE